MTRMIALAALAIAAPAVAQDGRAAALATLRANSTAAHSDVLLVMQDGIVLIDERRDPAADPLIEMMSATKGMVALAVMKAIDEGAIAGLDVPVATWFPEWRQGRKRAITLRMLLAHTSGLQNVANAGAEVEVAPDMVQLALAAELDAAPGARFAYNNKATNLLSGVIQRATGLRLDAYVADRLFRPMGIDRHRWRTDAAGNPQGMAGLQLAAPDMAKVGRLVMDRGRWAGRQLIRADLIDTMLAPGAPSSGDVALMWYRSPAWARYTIDTAGLDRVRATGLDAATVQRLQPLVGRRFDSREALRRALLDALGADGTPRWAAAMIRTGNTPDTLFTTTAGPIVAWSAQGYLGQVIVIVPAARIVAVRQYRSRPNPPRDDAYSGIIADVIALAEAR